MSTTRPRVRRARRIAGAVLVLAGAGALGDAVATVVWQEPVGALQASAEQRTLREQYAMLARGFAPALVPAPAPAHAHAHAHAADHSYDKAMVRSAHDAARLAKTTAEGRPLGRLSIPRLHLSEVWVQGTGSGSLEKGPGHYLGTALPGHRGTVGLAGHRTTHGAPFRHIDQLRRGDRIVVTMPYGAYSYAVQGTRIVSPSQVQVLRPSRSNRLVLTACHPLWSARQRIVVTAKLVGWPAKRLKPV